ncbi:MAG: hypothetical protein ACK4QW_18105 [Alphaproteobacteria bacterium]
MTRQSSVTDAHGAALPDDAEAQGRLVQAYVRQKWDPAADPEAVDQAGGSLAADLRQRIDLLGLDDRQLLYIDPGSVLHRIDRIERDQHDEDLGAAQGAVPRLESGPRRRTHGPSAGRKRGPS